LDDWPVNRPVSVADMQNLGAVRLMTVTHPDAPPTKVQSDQCKRGQEAKGNRGGRPVKRRDRFREKWLPLALKLGRSGWGVRRIAAEINRKSGRRISHMTVWKWLRRA